MPHDTPLAVIFALPARTREETLLAKTLANRCDREICWQLIFDESQLAIAAFNIQSGFCSTRQRHTRDTDI